MNKYVTHIFVCKTDHSLFTTTGEEGNIMLAIIFARVVIFFSTFNDITSRPCIDHTYWWMSVYVFLS